MPDFPAGPGIDLSGVFTPDARCRALLRALRLTVELAHRGPGKPKIPPLVRAHLEQLNFAADRFSVAAGVNVQASRGCGNAECRGCGDRSCSDRKLAGLSTSQVARVLEMTPRSVLNLIYRGSLRGTRSGRGWIVDMGSVAELCWQRRRANDESDDESRA